MTLVTQTQESFAGGAWPLQETVPADAVEDIVNGYVDEEKCVARRGGSTYRGPTSGLASAYVPMMFWDGYLAAGRRTVQVRRDPAAANDKVMLLSADESSWVTLTSAVTRTLLAGATVGKARMASLAGVLFYPDAGTQPKVQYIGSNLTYPAGATLGTVSLIEGSSKVTGSGGTNFTSSIVAGQALELESGSGATQHVFGVESVASDTELTIAAPWPLPDESFTVTHWGVSDFNALTSAALGGSFGFMVIGTVANRLLVGHGDRVNFSSAGDPGIFAESDNHRMPGGAIVTGIDSVRDSALIFTTNGVFAIRNMGFNLTDDAGNPQEQLQPLYPDLVLWGELGIAGWSGSLVVPATDGIYLLDGAGAPVGLGNEAMLRLLRSYVAAGYQPGLAAVYRSRYFLPIMNGNTWVDTLVCDLRSGAWARWDGHGGQVACFARRVADPTRQPLLLGLEAAGQRMLDLSSTLAPSSSVKNDADGTTHQWKVTLSTRAAGSLPVLWRKFRARLEIDDAASDNPTVTAEYSTGRPGSSFTALTGTAVEGDPIQTWPIKTSTGDGVRSRRLRIRLTSNNAAAKVVLRNAEWLSRRSGRVRT